MILNEQQAMIREIARKFANQRLKPNSADWDRNSTFPREALAEMGRLGFLGMTVPTEWGGIGADVVSLAVALEEIAAGDAACATIMSGHNSVGCMPIAMFGTTGQKERFLRPMAQGTMLSAFCLTEPQGGSDVGAMTARAFRDQAVHYKRKECRRSPDFRENRSGRGQPWYHRLYRSREFSRLYRRASGIEIRSACLGYLPDRARGSAHTG
jgi:alkylation response protein AidB-like acyl-CoA dehydrogenase